MKKYILSLHLVLLIFSLSAIQSSAERAPQRHELVPKIAISELIQAETSSSTNAANVEERFMRLARIAIYMRRQNMSEWDVLPRGKGEKIRMLIKKGNRDEAAALVSEAIKLLAKDNKDEIMPVLAQKTALTTDSTLDHTIDSDKFFWGTETYPGHIENLKDIISNTLKIKHFKIRLQQQMTSKDGKTFTGNVCLPSQNNCRLKYNLDEIVKIFKANNWSMIPMLSHDTSEPKVTNITIDNYVDFVDWFVSRYKDDANIRYVELINAPNMGLRSWRGTKEQLLELNNRVYDRIKSKYPNIMVGTPGFEHMIDSPSEDKSVQVIEYFLNKDNGARFDFWAFHGYPLMGNKFTGIYPPTKTAINNKYAGIQGIVEIRKKFDANGWQNRLIIDTEHTGTTLPKPTISDEDDSLDAAFTLQELILKRTLKHDGNFVLSGIINLKIAPRGEMAEMLFASLNPDGSLNRTVKAVSLLWSKLKEYRYSSHINGEFNNENQVWVEKFLAGSKELYIYFKPFKYQNGRTIKLDNETVQYSLPLSKKPTSIVLTDIKGNSISITASQTIALEAVNTPQFLEVSY